jgi:hypothetical protein
MPRTPSMIEAGVQRDTLKRSAGKEPNKHYTTSQEARLISTVNLVEDFGFPHAKRDLFWYCKVEKTQAYEILEGAKEEEERKQEGEYETDNIETGKTGSEDEEGVRVLGRCATPEQLHVPQGNKRKKA